jgi:GNAT superfamily N-acetyltransferase
VTWPVRRPNVLTVDRRERRSLPGAALRRIGALHTVDVVRRETAQPPPAVQVGAGFVLHRAASAQDPVLLRAPVGARRLKQVPAAMARGDVAYVATVDAQVVGWIWLSRVSHRDPWSGLRFRLAPAECYAYDLWSLPRYRTQGVGAFLLAGLLDDLAEDATLRWVYGYVDRANTPISCCCEWCSGLEPCRPSSTSACLTPAAGRYPSPIALQEGCARAVGEGWARASRSRR